jgi:CheY-like chemotaxis protein
MNLHTLPPAPPHEGSFVTVSPGELEQVHTRRILIADDDECIRQIISSVLAGDGFEVNTTVDGEQAWEALHQGHFDLLVTDNEMPRLAGLRLIERIRKEGMNLPVIVASGSLSPKEIRDNPLLQIAAVLPKPFELLELLDTVRQAMRVAGEAVAGHETVCQLHSNQ